MVTVVIYFCVSVARLSKTSDARRVVYQHKMEPKYVYTWLEVFSTNTDRLNNQMDIFHVNSRRCALYLAIWVGEWVTRRDLAWVSVFAANSKSSLPFHDGLLCAVVRNYIIDTIIDFDRFALWTESLYYHWRYHNSGCWDGEERTNSISNISV